MDGPRTKQQLLDELAEWKSKYRSLAAAHQVLEGKVATAHLQLELASKRVEHAQLNVDQRQAATQVALQQFNEKEQLYTRKLHALRAKLREVGYNGDLDNLGD